MNETLHSLKSAEASHESAEAIADVDRLLASVGLEHGRRASRGGAWSQGQRLPRGAFSKRGSQAEPPAREPDQDRPGIVRVPGWERFCWLRAGFSTRRGGRSTVYAAGDNAMGGDQNLGWTAEDDPDLVAGARRRFMEELAGSPDALELVTTRQFHSGIISTITAGYGSPSPDAQSLDSQSLGAQRAALRGDGLLTDLSGLGLAVLTADCVPVLVADTRTHAVAAFHAGWRGTLARIVERGIGSMRLRFNSSPEDLVAAVGPAIRACCFAVGEEVQHEFESQFAYAPRLFTDVYDSDPVREKYPLLFMTARAPGHSNLGPQIHLDLQEANRQQLLDAGLLPEAVQVVAECTACCRLPDDRRKYFSHRGEYGFTGRMLSVIGAMR